MAQWVSGSGRHSIFSSHDLSLCCCGVPVVAINILFAVPVRFHLGSRQFQCAKFTGYHLEIAYESGSRSAS